MADSVERSCLRDGNIAKVELPGLTSLRGIAALVVVLYHVEQMAHRIGATLPAIFGRGYLAVDLFFFLSGFVLAHVYAERLAELSAAAIGGFLWARCCRIYPTALFALAVTALACWLGMPLMIPAGSSFRAQFVAGLLMMQVPWLDVVGLNEPAWSVSAELYAYLAFPAILPVALRTPRRGAVFAALLAVIAAFHLLFGMQNAGEGALLRALPEFTAGILLYDLYQHRRLGHLFEKDTMLWGIAGAIGLACVLGAPDALVVALLPALILASVSNGAGGRVLFEAVPIRWLGDISYSLYIFQLVPLLGVTLLCWPLAQEGVGGAIAYEVIAASAMIAADALVHRRVDVPARAALRRLPDRLGAVMAARRGGLPVAAPVVVRRDRAEVNSDG